MTQPPWLLDGLTIDDVEADMPATWLCAIANGDAPTVWDEVDT